MGDLFFEFGGDPSVLPAPGETEFSFRFPVLFGFQGVTEILANRRELLVHCYEAAQCEFVQSEVRFQEAMHHPVDLLWKSFHKQRLCGKFEHVRTW